MLRNKKKKQGWETKTGYETPKESHQTDLTKLENSDISPSEPDHKCFRMYFTTDDCSWHPKGLLYLLNFRNILRGCDWWKYPGLSPDTSS